MVQNPNEAIVAPISPLARSPPVLVISVLPRRIRRRRRRRRCTCLWRHRSCRSFLSRFGIRCSLLPSPQSVSLPSPPLDIDSHITRRPAKNASWLRRITSTKVTRSPPPLLVVTNTEHEVIMGQGCPIKISVGSHILSDIVTYCLDCCGLLLKIIKWKFLPTKQLLLIIIRLIRYAISDNCCIKCNLAHAAKWVWRNK